MGFMKETLIDKMIKMDDLEEQQIKEYPHLMVDYWQKNADDSERSSYIEDMLIGKGLQWIDTFKSNDHLLKFIVDESRFQLNKDRISLLVKYESGYIKYHNSKYSFLEILEMLKKMEIGNSQFLECYLDGLD